MTKLYIDSFTECHTVFIMEIENNEIDKLNVSDIFCGFRWGGSVPVLSFARPHSKITYISIF